MKNGRLELIGAGLALAALVLGCAAKAPSSDWRDFAIEDFYKVHSAVEGGNKALIFGALPIARPPRGLSPELAAFLGRWEGFDFSPPVKKDIKGVLVIGEISPRGGKAYLWAGYNLQFPVLLKRIDFKVLPGANPVIAWKGDVTGLPNGASGIASYSFAYDKERHVLKGGIGLSPAAVLGGPFELKRDSSFFVYEDYKRYFESERFYPKKYADASLNHYGQGYLAYLPEGYEASPERKWPLILFLCGTGERGPDAYQFAKNGPFQMVREKAKLPFIIIAPMLDVSSEFRSFPEAYLDGVMAEIEADYRVDAKRLYLTGLSMGGEASYRYALHRPETFAAIAPLAAFDARFWPGFVQEGFVPFPDPPSRAKGLSIRAFHGADDTVVPADIGRATADEFRKAGAKVDFFLLEGHDHDVWTDTYLDPEFYDWLLRHVKP